MLVLDRYVIFHQFGGNRLRAPNFDLEVNRGLFWKHNYGVEMPVEFTEHVCKCLE